MSDAASLLPAIATGRKWPIRLAIVAVLPGLLFPLFVTLNMVPKVALGPLVIVWTGYGIACNIPITFSLCLFPVLLNTARGLREVEPELLDLVHALKGSRWQMFTKILAVAGAVVGEFIASERGLGYLMIQVQSTLDTPAMPMGLPLSLRAAQRRGNLQKHVRPSGDCRVAALLAMTGAGL